MFFFPVITLGKHAWCVYSLYLSTFCLLPSFYVSNTLFRISIFDVGFWVGARPTRWGVATTLAEHSWFAHPPHTYTHTLYVPHKHNTRTPHCHTLYTPCPHCTHTIHTVHHTRTLYTHCTHCTDTLCTHNVHHTHTHTHTHTRTHTLHTPLIRMGGEPPSLTPEQVERIKRKRAEVRCSLYC
jgi:ribosomal protein S27E